MMNSDNKHNEYDSLKKKKHNEYDKMHSSCKIKHPFFFVFLNN